MAIKFLSTVAVDTNVLYVDAANNRVGIGTAGPAYTLDVNGAAHSTSLTIADYIIHEGDTNTYIGFPSSDTITCTTAGSERTRVTSAGDVGIGTTNPRAKLDVDGGVKVANDTDSASANKVGTLRYRYAPSSPKSQSMVDMCMQTGPSTYAWVNIVTNTWNN